jgi:hypothetical protein
VVVCRDTHTGGRRRRQNRRKCGHSKPALTLLRRRYDKGAEQQLFEVLSGRIQEITAIFGTVPNFIVDRWVDDMLENKKWDESRLLTVISDQRQNPFVVKETTESLDADWDGTTEGS